MPQLMPFFFNNQLLCSYIILLSIIFLVSKYFLPQITLLQTIRLYIEKLNNNS